MMEDRILIWKLKRGSPDALRRIYEKYKNDLLKLAVSLAGDINTAEDVVQDMFVSFAQSAARIGVSGDLRSYLVACVANRIRNRRRDRQRHEAIGFDGAEQLVGNFRGPEQWAILNEELRSLSQATAHGTLSNEEVATAVVRGFFEALKAGDYDAAGRLLPIGAAFLQEHFGGVKILRIVSVGPATLSSGPGKEVAVPCTVEIEENGRSNTVTLPSITVHPLAAQPDRWTIQSLGD